MFTAFIIAFTFIATSAFAQLEHRLEYYLYSKSFSLEGVPADPNNRLFNRPKLIAVWDFRPEFKYNVQDTHKIVLRPRWILSYENIKYADSDSSVLRGSGKVDLTDAYWESVWTESVRTTLGLQVYQWGPAEFLNASNPIYHLNAQQRSTLFKEKGKFLVRVNIDYSRNWNQVFIVEPMSNAEPTWIDNDKFVEKGLVKSEWVSENGMDSLGFVFGKEERNRNFIGEYLSYSPSEGFTLYLDARHTQGSIAYYPTANAFGTESLTYDDSKKTEWENFGIVGVRKEWSHLDLRFEHIFNSAGWTAQQFTLAKKALVTLNPDIVSNLTHFARPGLELLGQSYSYLSLRFFNFGSKNEHSFSFRYLYANTDASGTMVSTYDWNYNDNVNIFAEHSATAGPAESELNILPQQSYMLGLRWSL